jgi:hypothetical protein
LHSDGGVPRAGVPLLRKTRMGFVPRLASEIATLLKSAYGKDHADLQLRLRAIADALNSGDFAKAMIVAIHSRTPELSSETAFRLAKADRELAKYNYNPDESRDWHGRWTPRFRLLPVVSTRLFTWSMNARSFGNTWRLPGW